MMPRTEAKQSDRSLFAYRLGSHPNAPHKGCQILILPFGTRVALMSLLPFFVGVTGGNLKED